MSDINSKKISLISPNRRQGTTFLSIILGLYYSQTQRVKVCITHLGPDNDSLQTYLGANIQSDKTKSLEQMYQLIEMGQITPEELLDYTQNICEGLYLLDATAPYLEYEMQKELLKKVIGVIAVDIVIMDVDTEIYDDITQDMLKISDIIIIVLQQSIDVTKKIKLWRDSQFYDIIESIGEIYILNEFIKDVGSIKEFCRLAGLDYRWCEKASFSPVARKLFNNGRAFGVITSILNNNPNTLELNSDIFHIITKINENIGVKTVNWEKERQDKKDKQTIETTGSKRKRVR